MPRLIARKPRTPGRADFQKHISRSLSKGLGGGKPRPGHIGATIQRTTDEAIAMAHEHNESQLHGEIQREIAHEQQGGQTIPDANRQELEDTFQADLRGVRVHTDANADTLARSLDAKAFTTGADIFFGKGEYNPGSDSGKRLLAHEVTHVMQQGAAARQTHSAPPTPPRTIQPKLRVNHPNDKFEQEADAAADLATRPLAASPSRSLAHSPTRPLQREDDKATLVAPGGQVTETNQTSGGGDNSPAKAKVSEQTDNGKAKGAAEGASKGAQADTKKTGDKAKGEAKQGEAAARGDQGKTGGAGNSQTSDTLALPQETMANMQQLPPTVQDASGTEAKLGNAPTAALEVPDVTPEAVLPNWSDLAAGTVQLAKKDDEKKKQEEHKKELVGGAKKNNAGKKEAKPKEVKSDKKEPKAADAAAKNADKAAESAGGGEGGGEAKGGGEQKVAELPPPEPAPQLPPLPELPHPSEQGGVQPVGSFPSIDAQGVSEELAWMQSPHLAKISAVVSSGLLAEKVQDAQKKPPAPKGGEGKAQRKAAAAPGLIQRTPSGLLTPGTPLGYERNDSGLYLPASEPITTPTLPNTVGGLTTGLNSGFVSRAMGNSLIQRAPFSLTGLAGDISQQAVGTANQQFVQRQAGGEVDEMGMFGFLGPELAGLLAGGGIQSLLSAGPGMDMNAAMQQAGGGGFAEGMLSSGGALDVLGSVGQNMGNTASMLPAPNPGFINAAAQQFSPVNWFDQTVGGVGDSASAVASSFASISSEGTVWGKIAATMESLGTVIDLISQILDIISTILTVVDVLCTVMIALAPITIIVVLVPIFPFIWTPAVFSPIKAGVATASRIIDMIGNVLGTVSQVLLYGATIFRFLDMIETLADPKPSEERQAKLDQHVAQFTQQTMDAFSPSMQDEVNQSKANRDSKTTGQLERMKQRRQGKANAGAPPPEPPDGLPPLPMEAAPDTFSDYGDQSGELAATEQALQMQQEEISQMMELGQAGIESIQSSREQTKANRKGVEGHKKDMNKKVGEQKKMKAKTGGGKGKMGAGKAGGGKGKALMKVVMPMIMPLLSFAMTWGAGGGTDTGGAKDGAEKQSTQMSGFFSATNIADTLSAQRIMQTTMLIAQAGKSDDQLGGLDSFLGEKFDAGQQGLGLLQQDGSLIAEQLALVQQDRQAMTNQQNQSAGMMGSWMQSSQMARQQMFMQLEQSLGVITAGQEQ
ncbi:MAG: DUF4157 domain-containing protein [Chloroflexi bacterium]|nr:DUF4157 domain-containing protein [Chloroflexota bacterium]